MHSECFQMRLLSCNLPAFFTWFYMGSRLHCLLFINSWFFSPLFLFLFFFLAQKICPGEKDRTTSQCIVSTCKLENCLIHYLNEESFQFYKCQFLHLQNEICARQRQWKKLRNLTVCRNMKMKTRPSRLPSWTTVKPAQWGLNILFEHGMLTECWEIKHKTGMGRWNGVSGIQNGNTPCCNTCFLFLNRYHGQSSTFCSMR